MISLIFVVCLAAQPQQCEERSLTFIESLSPGACVAQAQPELARWAAEHPIWRIQRWTCSNAASRAIRA